MSATTRMNVPSLGIVATLLVAALALATLFSSPPSEAAGRTLVVAPQSAGGVQLDTGRVVVQFNAGVPASDRAAVHRGFGATVIDTLPALRIDVVELPNTSATQAVAGAYERHPLVTFAEPDALAFPVDGATLAPNDPYLPLQWQHTAVDSPGAWAVTSGDSALRATVCDTGVEGSHPDLIGNLDASLGYNAVDDALGNWSPIHPHGTFVAGMIAATGNNSMGVAGAAWNATIIPVRISNLSSGGAYFSDMADCIIYGTDYNSLAINLSYQTYSSGRISPTILAAAQYANDRGSVLIVAAGNENTNPAKRGDKDPANIVYVASTDEGGGTSSFSNHGPFVDVAAPGRDVVSTYTGGSYAYWSGTSFSAPLVAGAALLVADALGVSPDGAADADCIRSALIAGAVDAGAPGEDNSYGAGILNSHNAVHFAGCGGGDVGGLTVTINQAGGQADPTSSSPVNFTVVFSGAVTDFENGDVTLGGSAGATTAEVTGSGTTYNVAVSGMIGSGAVVASIAAGVATDGEGNPNAASTSTDNTVTYTVPSAGTVTVESISYGWSGGRDGMKHLTATAAIVDDGGAPVSDALVAATLIRDGGVSSWDFSGTTDVDGSVSFKLIGAGDLGGCFDLDVTAVTGAGTWDGDQPDDSPGACK